MNSAGDLEVLDPKMKDEEVSDEGEATSEEDDDSEDDVETIARIQKTHYAQTAAMARNRRPAPLRQRRMSQKRKMEAVKSFHDFTKKLKKDTGIAIRSIVGNSILDFSDGSSEEYQSDSDGLSEEDFVVDPTAVNDLNQEDESYIDPETGDFVEAKKTVKPKSPIPEPEVNTEPKTLTINDLINEDIDLSKNVEISEVDQGELCPEKTAEELLGMKQEDISQDSDVGDKLDDGKDTGGNTDKEDDKKSENDEEKKAANPNAINVRRNIRDVMDEKNLDASTLAAQRQESERLARVQEQQRIIREVQRQIAINRQNKIQQKTLSLLQGGSSLLKKALPGQKLNLPNTVLVKLPSGEVKKTIVKQGQLDVTKISKPTTSASAQKLVKSEQKTEKKEVVEIVDSSSGDDSSSSSSDSDDCIMLSDSEVPPSPEAEDDPGNSGLHVNDTYNLPDEQGRVLINLGHPENEEDIFLAPQIARIIKPHQIGGVRFLFDNIIESTERFSTSTGFGCILAHSMGLGKTLQIVCFCDIFLRHTKSKTVLCIMPINTLQNWVAEFNKWLPYDVTNCPLAAQGEVRPRNFPIYVLNDSHKTLAMRAKVIKDWSSNGGVLMIGYELYRLLSMKKDKKPRKKRKADAKQDEKDKDEKKSDKPEVMNEDTQSSDVTNQSKQSEESKQDKDENGTEQKDDKDEGKKEEEPYNGDKKLLDEMYEALVKPGPDLVICDEGHRIKNSHSNISYALKQMRTKRRIVLTGYPLQNNLLEYWCMVDFVRPNYLGSKTEFCNMFERPIQNGQCIDSTPQDIRLMRYRAHVLHSLLVGFVQRRSHAVLQSTLPQKEEYVLLIRMTPLQRKLYDRFMNEVVRSISQPNPLKAFAICCKIWNHPDVLYHFLRKRSEASAAIEEDLDLDEISGTTRVTRATTAARGRRPGRQRGPPKKPAATIPPNQSGPPKSEPNYNNPPYPPNGPYGPNYQNSDRPFNQYGNFPNQPQGYYPPNQQYNQNYTNNYYQQQPYGNNYPNQYPANNTEQYNNQNYWGNGYYGNQGYYNNQQPASQYPNNQQTAPQYPNNQPPAAPYPNNQQPAAPYPNNQQPAAPYPNNQQPAAPYPNNQQPAAPYPNNQQPAAPYPNNQQPAAPYPNNQQPATSFPNNQQPATPYPNNQQSVPQYSNNQQVVPQYPAQQYPPNYNGPSSDPNYQTNAVQPYQPNQDTYNNQQPFPPSGYQNQTPGYQNPPTFDPSFNATSPQEYPQPAGAGYTHPYPGQYPTPYNPPPYDPQSQSSFTGYQGPNALPPIKAEPHNYPEPATAANPTQPTTEYPNQGYYNNTPPQFPPQPTNPTYQYEGYQQTPIETKPPLSSTASGGSVGSPLTSWPIAEALKTEEHPIKYEEKTEIKSESDSEVKIADLDTKKIVDKTKNEEKESPVKKEEKTEDKDGKEKNEKKNSDSDEETPKKGKRGGRAKKTESKRGKNKPKVKGRKDRKNSKEKDDSESEESEKEEKRNREEEYAIMKKAEEVTYDWAAELLKDYLPGIIENSAKMQLFFYILNESIKLGDRVLLFSQSLFTLNLIEDFLERNYIPGTNYLWKRNTSYYRLDGSTHALEREKLINEFNANPHVYLFLVSTRAGSLGINLVGANRVIVFDASWNPCHDTQAVCRVYRYGQRKPCFVYRFVMDFCLEKKIYDRQINKQGMADRVVDECNPDAVLSMKEITNLCFDNDEKETEPKDLSEHKDKYIDVIMQSIIGDFGKLLSKEPFQHESLLVDRKEKKLSSAEKRLAQRGYELEKKAALSPRVAYRTVRAADGSLVQRPVASVRPMQHAARWIPADVWRRQGMTAQEMTLPLDVVIPTNSSEKTNIVLKAGQRVMVLKSPKGIYMQLESGKIIAIKTSLKGIGQKPADGKDPKKMIPNRPTSASLPGSLKNNSAITITSKSGPRPLPSLQRVIRPPMGGQNRTIRPFAPGPKTDFRQRLVGDRMLQGVRKLPPGKLRPNFPGSLSITKITKDPQKTDNFKKEETNTEKTDDDAETQVLDSDDEEQKPQNNQVQSSEENTNDSTSSSSNKKTDESVKTSETEKANETEETSETRKTTENKPIVLTTEEKLPDEASLDNKSEVQHRKSTDEIQYSPNSHYDHPDKTNKVNLLKNYRHQRLAGRPATESSLSQLEKTATSFNTDVMPAFRKNLDTITQSYTPNTEEKPAPKPKQRKKKVNKTDNESSPAMSHSVSSLLGVKETSSDSNVSPLPPSPQARLGNPMHSGPQGAFGPPMVHSPMLGPMDPAKASPMPLPPVGTYAAPGLPPEAPFGQYPPPPPNYGYGYPPSSGYYPPYLPPSAPDTHWYPHQGT